MSASDEGAPLFVGLARARFGLGMAPSEMTAAWGKWFKGTNPSPRKGGARLFVVNGMAREPPQGLGGWTSPAVMEGLYAKARSEEVVPVLRSAGTKARAVLEVTSFVEDLDWDTCADGEEAPSSARGFAARIWFRRFCSLRESLVPVVLVPICDSFRALMGRRVRLLNLSDPQRREALFCSSEPPMLIQTRGRNAALSSPPIERPRCELYLFLDIVS